MSRFKIGLLLFTLGMAVQVAIRTRSPVSQETEIQLKNYASCIKANADRLAVLGEDARALVNKVQDACDVEFKAFEAAQREDLTATLGPNGDSANVSQNLANRHRDNLREIALKRILKARIAAVD